ncbi:MAG: UvrD-helicase domain-containing protein [Bryobacterales bacterium]|nr:UvrD-helicase domain-containing protein [Bryobacterales bacterium]
MTPAWSTGDAAARDAIRHALDESLFVEAAAGTGKTTELVRRIVAVLASGRARVEGIVAVTFTRKAAGELKLRLRQMLDEARAAETGAGSMNLEDAVARLEEARIGTIDAFCADLLRERPVEAAADPGFDMLGEHDRRLYRSAFSRWFEDALARQLPAVRRVVQRAAGNNDRRPVAWQLEDAGWTLVERRDYHAPWERPPFDRKPAIDRLVDLLFEARAIARGAGHVPQPVAMLTHWIERAERESPRDYELLEARFLELPSPLTYKHKMPRSQRLAPAREKVEELIAAIRDFKPVADADLAAGLREEMRPLLDAFAAAKRRAGVMDFLDVLTRVRDLLATQPAVRAFLQKRFTHLFVDEFQDTDPLQMEILLLLAAGDPTVSDWRQSRPAPGKLFLVGDPKQSIYRFRRADVMLYQAVSRQLREAGVRTVLLSRSFRATAPLQAAINHGFSVAIEESAEYGQPAYVPLENERGAIPGQPPLVVLPVPRPYGQRNVTKTQIAVSLPDASAAYIAWLIRESGWSVTDPEGGARVPIAPRHICLLFRRYIHYRADVTQPYVRALDAREIPHVLVGARSFFHREEVETLRAALTAIEWPDDELAVYATLKGSLFAIPDATLFRYREAYGRLNPFGKQPESGFDDVREVLDLLAGLTRRRNRRPVVATLEELLEAARASAGFALRHGGEQVLANVARVRDLARGFELNGGLSFRGFVEHLNEQAAREETPEAPMVEDGGDGVRLMTVHNAKGLEFPVVILADLGCQLTQAEPAQVTDRERRLCAMRLAGCLPLDLLAQAPLERERERAEAIRVAYVAATRARDLLVVPGVGDGPVDGWLSPLTPSLYPDRTSWRKSVPPAGCPPFGEDSVLEAPGISRAEDDSVRPGLHRIGGHDVVWWDPQYLALDVEGRSGLRREELLADDHGAGVAGRGQEAYRDWAARRRTDRDRGAVPELTPVLVTAMPDWPEPRPEVRVAKVERGDDRPGGKRFGALVHAVLREAPLDADRYRIEAIARIKARVLGAAPDEEAAVPEAVLGALAHPLLRRAGAASRVQREWPLLLPLEGGRFLEGVLDLAYWLDGRWTVVDFKTDVVLDSGYERQVAWYAHAVRRITGQDADAWLLQI